MKKLLLLLNILALVAGCAYKFNGASIPPTMKTVNVQFFENTALLVEPTLAQQFTEELKNRIRTQTRLNMIQSLEADAVFEGKITNYTIQPIAIQDNNNPTAGGNRLTITVQVKYTINVKNQAEDGKPPAKDEQGFEESFSAYTDIPASMSFETQKQDLLKKVNLQLTENIFNRAFAQW